MLPLMVRKGSLAMCLKSLGLPKKKSYKVC